jgi:hypothetical protein
LTCRAEKAHHLGRYDNAARIIQEYLEPRRCRRRPAATLDRLIDLLGARKLPDAVDRWKPDLACAKMQKPF